jgi:SOS regulatory protein LexA
MLALTPNQKDFLNTLKKQYRDGPLPSIRQIAKDLEYKYHNSVQNYLEALMFSGMVKKIDSFLYLDKKMFGLKLFDSRIPAGLPATAEDSYEVFDFENYMHANEERSFMLRVSGDSMIDAGIYDGDLIIVDTKIPATHGLIVVAIIDGGYTVKYLRKKGSTNYLKAANPNYKDIYPENEFKIVGVVTGSIRKF